MRVSRTAKNFGQQKPHNGRYSVLVRIDEDTYNKLVKIAKEDDVAIANVIRKAIRNLLKEQ